MKRFLSVVTLLALTALVSACSSSGGSGGGTPAPSGKQIQGVLVDPPIRDARVEIRTQDGAIAAICGINGNQMCNVWSDADGRFAFNLFSNVDMNTLSIVSYGGYDEGYGIDMDGISLSTSLSLFAADSNNSYDVVISPVTSIVNNLIKSGVNKAAALATARVALGLPDNVSLSANPMDEPEILKASYMIIKIAQMQNDAGVLEPLGDIAAALRTHGGSLYTDSVLGALNLTTAQKEAVQASRIAVDAISGGTQEIITGIASGEKSQIFLQALGKQLNAPANLPAAYTNNVNSLLTWLEAKTNGIALNELVITQLVAYLANMDAALFGTYSSYLDEAAFTAALSGYTLSTTDSATLKYISKEALYVSSLPLASPLGNDNDKRVNYYYNSNADFNVVARDMISEVYEDGSADTIYQDMSISYAKMGLHRKAARLADAYISASITRAETYRLIGWNTSIYSAAAGEYYTDKAKELADNLYAQSGAQNNISDLYQLIVSSYERSKAYTKAETLRNWLISDYLDNIPDNATPKRFTVHGRLISSVQNKVMPAIIESGDYDLAVNTLNMFVGLIDNLDANTGSKPYSLHMVYYGTALEFCYQVAQGAPALEPQMKALAQNVWNSYKERIEFTKAGGYDRQYLNASYVPAAAAYLHWLGGTELVESNVFTLIEEHNKLDNGSTVLTDSTKQSAIMRAAFEVMNRIAYESDFDTALAFYTSKVTHSAEDGYSTVFATYGLRDTFTYLSSTNPGFTMRAYQNGNRALAEKGLAYIVPILDEAAAYYSSNHIDGLTNFTGSLTVKGAYVRAAEIYALLDNTTAMTALLQKAESYPAAMGNSSAKSAAYAAIASVYFANGMQAEADRLLDLVNAGATEATALMTAKDRSTYYLTLADYTLNYRDNKPLAESLLALAHTAAQAYTTPGGTDANIRTEAELLIPLTDRYVKTGNTTKVMEILNEAEALGSTITASAIRRAVYDKIILQYATLGYYSVAYAKAKALITAKADLFTTIYNVASQVTKRNDFPKCDVAFIDTDHDGKPDFFAPFATAEQIAACGLVLDDDIDGDGKPDTLDLTPFYAD